MPNSLARVYPARLAIAPISNGTLLALTLYCLSTSEIQEKFQCLFSKPDRPLHSSDRGSFHKSYAVLDGLIPS